MRQGERRAKVLGRLRARLARLEELARGDAGDRPPVGPGNRRLGRVLPVADSPDAADHDVADRDRRSEQEAVQHGTLRPAGEAWMIAVEHD